MTDYDDVAFRPATCNADAARHALYVGWVLGLARRQGLDASPVHNDDGTYANRIVVRLDDEGEVAFIVPPPPDDWALP